jgi:photosystem II stability/assembly factor-like uncharacterized protein
MKKIIFTLFIIHFSLLIANAQWLQQNSGTEENLYDIKFINKNTGWTLGDGGIVLKTTNGGDNWINIPNPSITAGGILSTVFPVDSNIVYVVGGHEVILKTTNGGINWIEIRNGPYGCGSGFESVFFLNKDTGWFCGSMRVLRTTNGGLTFDSAGIFWGSLHDMYFKDFNTGIICGDGRVFKTTDGGLNWFNTDVPTNGIAAMFMKIGVVENQYVWVIGSNAAGVYKSTNFATTWSKVDSTMGADGLYFINRNTGFLGGALNKVFKTTDGGYNWRREKTDTGVVVALITSMYFVNDSIGWYASCAGKIFHTTTGGQPLQITNISKQIIDDFKLYQNYPNPFNSVSSIKYQVLRSSNIKLVVFNILGKEVATLVNEKQLSGIYEVSFDCGNLSSGVYFYRLIADGNIIDTKKLTLIK